MNRFVLLIPLILSCSTVVVSRASVPIFPSVFRSLQVGRTVRSEVRASLGAPFQQVESTDGKWEAESFSNGRPGLETVLTLGFDQSTGILQSIDYTVGAREKMTFDDARKSFPESSFSRREEAARQKDYVFTRVRFVDERTGISIFMNDYHSDIVDAMSCSKPGAEIKSASWKVIENRVPASGRRP